MSCKAGLVTNKTRPLSVTRNHHSIIFTRNTSTYTYTFIFSNKKDLKTPTQRGFFSPDFDIR